MTDKFIIISFVIIAIYDIIALVKGWRTITGCFRRWYGIKPHKEKGLPAVPFAVSSIFIGHMGLPIDFSFMPKYLALCLFIGISLFVIIWTAVGAFRRYIDPDDMGRVFYFMQNKWYLSMAFGVVIGSLWWL